MNYYLIKFKASYYGWYNKTEDVELTRLVSSTSFVEACEKIRKSNTLDWEYESPWDFENLTLE